MPEFNLNEFAEASDHSFSCKCAKCLNWWLALGPDEGFSFGPFTEGEIRAALGANADETFKRWREEQAAEAD